MKEQYVFKNITGRMTRCWRKKRCFEECVKGNPEKKRHYGIYIFHEGKEQTF